MPQRRAGRPYPAPAGHILNTPDPVYFTVWPCINSTRLLVLVSVESVHLPFLEVWNELITELNLQKRQMDRLYGD